MTEKKSARPYPGALLNPRLDANFKALFTHNSPESRRALKSFLEAVLGAKVSNIELAPNELPEDSTTDKQAQFDVSCVLNGKDAVNIEIQGLDVDNCYAKRAEYYVAHLLNHYTPRGIDWQDVPKVFQISVLNFIYDETSPRSLSVYTMQTDDSRKLTDRMSIIFIELPKMKQNESEESLNSLTAAEKWGKFLLYADRAEKQDYVSKLCRSTEGLMDAQVTLAKISQDEANWLREMSIDKRQRDISSAIRAGRENGIAEGFQRGMETGIQRGIQQGIQNGIQQKAIETAKKALSLGLDVETVCKISGLAKDEIENLCY